MNIKTSIWIIMLGMVFLQGCDSGGILDDEKDQHPLVPDVPPQIDPSTPRPPEDAKVITTSADQIIDAAGNPVLLRGINLQYAQNPNERINGIPAIRSVGSNVVRLQLSKSTTAVQLEGALERVVEEGLIAILSFWGPEGEIACTSSSTQLDAAVYNLWLNAWMPVLSQGRFQPYMMLNIASGWGPPSIFTASAVQSYEAYIAAYKEYIARFRSVGFKVPLVIDAPGCGEDHFAFVSGRGDELLAADTERNLVFSVQAFRSAWNTETKIRENIGDLQRLPAPFILGSFGGSGVPGNVAVDHEQLMYMATGDYALKLSLPWSGPEDVVALSYPLDEPKDIIGLGVTFEAFIPQGYIDAGGALSMQLVLENASGEYALSNPSPATGRLRNRWNSYSFAVTDAADLAEQSENFDPAEVTRVGVRIAANGKAATVVGDILIDNFVISAAPEPIFTSRFTNGLEGWFRPFGVVGDASSLSVVDGALAVLAPWSAGGNIALRTDAIAASQPPMDLEESFTVSFRVFVPQEYASETGITLQPFLQDGSNNFVFSGIGFFPFRAPDFKFGEWNTVTATQANFPDYLLSDGYEGNDNFNPAIRPNGIGIEISGIQTAKTQPILIDDFKVESSVTRSIRRDTVYENALANWNYVFGAGNESSVTFDAGVLSILAPWTSTANATSAGHTLVPDQPTPLYVNSPFVVSFEIFIPEEYGTEALMAIQPFVMDASDVPVFAGLKYIQVAGGIALGSWQTIEVAINDMTSEGSLQPGYDVNDPVTQIGVQVVQVQSAKTEPVRVRNFEVETVTEVQESALFELEFETEEEVADFEFIDRPELSDSTWLSSFNVDTKTHTFGIQPFGWLAWAWTGNVDQNAGWNLSTLDGFVVPGDAESGVDLTDRGEDVVNGVYGIMMTAEPAGFPQ